MTISTAPGGVWLDIRGRAGVLFDVDEWAQLTAESLALLLELAGNDAHPV